MLIHLEKRETGFCLSPELIELLTDKPSEPPLQYLTQEEINKMDKMDQLSTQGYWFLMTDENFYGEIHVIDEKEHFLHIADTPQHDEQEDNLNFLCELKNNYRKMINEIKYFRSRFGNPKDNESNSNG